ncbi:MAG: hydrogenase 3 maturation endopeptidase HyCI [Anaerolineae bacterium]
MSSWQSSLQTRLAKHPRPKVAILGIGHELRGDDAVGVVVARELQSIVGTNYDSLYASSRLAQRPRRLQGKLRRFRPDLVIMVDAAQMDQPPGGIRTIERQDALGLSASTHTLPLSVIAEYLVNELGCDIIIIGIQPAANEFDTPLSSQVRRAADEVIAGLQSILLTAPAA